MPKRKRSTKHVFRRKKAFRSKRSSFKRRSRASTLVLKRPTGFPDRVVVKLRVVETFEATITTAGLQASALTVAGNSILDPYLASGTVQPYGLDQWANFYERARVHGSKIRVHSVPVKNSADTSIPPGQWWMWTVVVPSTANTTTAVNDYWEQLPRAKWNEANIYTDIKQAEIRHYASTAQIWGVDKKAVRAEDDFTQLSTGTTSPTNLWYWHIATGLRHDPGANYLMGMTVELVYYVEFYKRADLNKS